MLTCLAPNTPLPHAVASSSSSDSGSGSDEDAPAPLAALALTTRRSPAAAATPTTIAKRKPTVLRAADETFLVAGALAPTTDLPRGVEPPASPSPAPTAVAAIVWKGAVSNPGGPEVGDTARTVPPSR